jgi:hypothetical protein
MTNEDILQGADHPLLAVMAGLARDRYPEADGMVEIMPTPPGALAAILAFTGHHIVAADVPSRWVDSFCPSGDLLAPIGPPFLAALTNRLGRSPGPLDLVLMGSGLAGDPPLPLCPLKGDALHPRARRALRVRTDVQIYTTSAREGLLTVGRGLAGRWEAGFEVESSARNRGLGRALARAARYLIPPHEVLFLQVAVGNVASLRAVLAAGFLPVCSEILFFPDERQ